MASKVAKVGLKKESGWLYYLDKKGHISRSKRAIGRKAPKGKAQVVVKLGFKRVKDYLYFIDKGGDLAAAKMSRRGRKKKR